MSSTPCTRLSYNPATQKLELWVDAAEDQCCGELRRDWQLTASFNLDEFLQGLQTVIEHPHLPYNF